MTFFSAFVGTCFYFSWKQKNFVPAVFALVLILIAWIWGTNEMNFWKKLPHESMRVGIVQPNMSDHEKAAVFNQSWKQLNQVFRHLLTLTKELSDQNPKPDLVVWSETAYPLSFLARDGDFFEPYEKIYSDILLEQVNKSQTSLLFGGFEKTAEGSYNSAILINSSGKSIDSHRKNILLVFGEYMPLTKLFPQLKEFVPHAGDFQVGQNPHPLRLEIAPGKFVNIGANICYEADFPDFLRNLKNQGADVYINLTKDSWYGDTQEPWQHFMVAAFRSIETHTPMVRVTNTGLSGIISPIGESELLSRPYVSTAKIFELPLYSRELPKTLFQTFGDWFAQVCVCLTLILGFWAMWRSRIARSK